MKTFFFFSFLMTSILCQAQYVQKVQRQVYFDVLRARAYDILISKQDSVLHAYQKEIADMAKTVSDCRVLNSDYENQISLLKQVNFTDQKEIILLNKDKKRFKRQTFWLKVLIPVAVAGTLWLDNR